VLTSPAPLARPRSTSLDNLRTVLLRRAGSVQFGDTVVQASCGKVRLGPVLTSPAPLASVFLSVPGSTRAGPWRVDVSTSPLDATEASAGCVIDAVAIHGALRVRQVRDGDRMMYRRIERKVTDVLSTARVPRWERPGIIAVADGSRLLALLGASRTVCEPHRTEDVLYVRVSPLTQTGWPG
jgi:tRNA(Ile)-lysidine synthetase-like protein